ncbi:carbonic anhydrase [Plantactinospora siamensis]|uniref:Carbonic anhydrase n=1 Tax=Plantactinospora siamensis TaxID=555372 RepID=A0ABV6P2D6_9ACTN
MASPSADPTLVPGERPSSISPSSTRTPRAALAELLAGNRRFVGGQPLHGHDVAAAAAASGDQRPHAVVVGCIDSRVPLEAVFDQTFGSMCVVRSGAHVLDQAVRGSIDFAVTVLGVPLVMVLGHERCGAVAATVRALQTGDRPGGGLGYLVDEIAPAVLDVGLDDPRVASAATRRHIIRTVAELAAREPLASAVADGSVEVVGAIYDLDSGRVDLLA